VFLENFSVPSSETEVTNFLNGIKDCPSKPALLSLVPAHSDSYVSKSVNPELPVVLSSLTTASLMQTILLY